MTGTTTAAPGYAWWVRRVRHALGIYDILRIDHFRGFDTYWAIPAGETTAKNGRWEQGPGMELFRALRTALGDLPIVAEDLGELFDSVRELLKASGFPGMKVLQFGLDGTDNEYLPHNYPANCVCYPGTHDNDTLLGWWENGAAEAERKQLTEYLALTPAEGGEKRRAAGRAGQARRCWRSSPWRTGWAWAARRASMCRAAPTATGSGVPPTPP